MVELNLSDKITKCGLCKENLQPFLRVEDVKKSIQELKEEFCLYRKQLVCKNDCIKCRRINKIFGDKLI